MPRGGARKGAGRKPKPLAEKIAEGNRGNRPLKKVEFAGDAGAISKTPPEYLRVMEKRQNPVEGVPTPMDIYAEIVAYLEPSECLPLIPTALISDYVMAKYYLLYAQAEMSVIPLVAKTGEKKSDDGKLYPVYKITDFTEAMLKLQKNVVTCWTPIWDIVSRNSERLIENPETDLIAMILTGRQRRKSKEVTSVQQS